MKTIPFIRTLCAHETDLEVLSVKWERAANQGVEYHPEAPDVHLWTVVLLTCQAAQSHAVSLVVIVCTAIS